VRRQSAGTEKHEVVNDYFVPTAQQLGNENAPFVASAPGDQYSHHRDIGNVNLRFMPLTGLRIGNHCSRLASPSPRSFWVPGYVRPQERLESAKTGKEVEVQTAQAVDELK
jgi:hypothetical protein